MNLGSAMILACVVLLAAGGSPPLQAHGDGTFRSPTTLPNAGRPGPATVHAGDLDGDGKLDLISANGSSRILVYFQSPSSRDDWRQVPLPVGSQVWFVRAADFTGDGRDDLIASDLSATAFFIESLPGGAFRPPVAVREAQGARWTAIGDWNGDAKLDFATANISAADITVFLGDGMGGFTLKQRLVGSREHALEALDYDGDGIFDLFLGGGLDGLTPHRGLGDGTFRVETRFDHMGCVEYLAEVGHYEGGAYLLHGDLNGDGKGDLSPTCVETTSVSAGISLGDGSYDETLESQAGADVDSSALHDLNGDGKTDLAVVSKKSTRLLAFLGVGDGTFEPEPVTFGPTGDTPVFLVVRDLDRDGFVDVISGDQLSSTITIFWGRSGERFLESASTITGFGSSRSLAVADLEGTGEPDLFLPRSDRPEVQVYLQPGTSPANAPSFTITTESRATLIEAADLDGDGDADLAGIDPIGGDLIIALLDGAGAVRGGQRLATGISPAAVRIVQLDGGALDIAVPVKGSNHVAVFTGQGAGAFGEAKNMPTIEQPKGVAAGDWDADGVQDLAVISDTKAVLHFGTGGGYEEARGIAGDASVLFTDVVAGDVDGDGRLDALVADSKNLSVLLIRGPGSRALEPPVPIKTSGAPVSLVAADLDGDGDLDITTVSSSARSAAVLLQEPDLEFRSLTYGLGMVPLGHRLADLDMDGALDLVASSQDTVAVLPGRTGGPTPTLFLRGDTSGDGAILMNDAIGILIRLFQGGEPLPCDDAADADDTGAVDLTDAITILGHLFLGRGPLPPPGPDDCGLDPGADELGCEAACP